MLPIIYANALSLQGGTFRCEADFYHLDQAEQNHSFLHWIQQELLKFNKYLFWTPNTSD